MKQYQNVSKIILANQVKKNLVSNYQCKMNFFADSTVRNWLLLNSPVYMIIILTCYFTMLYFGQKLMENRSPFQLRKTLIVYNFGQVVFSAYICKEVIVSAYLSKYKFSCSEIDYSNKELTTRVNFL